MTYKGFYRAFTFKESEFECSRTFWVEAVNGSLVHENSLFTTEEFNRDWNGIMFDLTSEKEAILDSLHINMFSVGEQVLEVYKKEGSLIGEELDASQWSLYKIDTLQVDSSGELVNLPDLNLLLFPVIPLRCIFNCKTRRRT